MKNKKTLAVILSMSLVFSSAVSSAGAETDYDNSDISTFEMDGESDLIYDSDEISLGDINADGKVDPFYEYLQDTEKLESLSFDEINEMLNITFPDDSDIDPEDIYSPAGMKLLHALFDSYEFLEAYILDNDTIIINNGTGFLLSVESIVVTRNGKTSTSCVPDVII